MEQDPGTQSRGSDTGASLSTEPAKKGVGSHLGTFASLAEGRDPDQADAGGEAEARQGVTDGVVGWGLPGREREGMRPERQTYPAAEPSLLSKSVALPSGHTTGS